MHYITMGVSENPQKSRYLNLDKMPKIEFVKAEVLAQNGTVGTYQSGSGGFKTPGAYCDGHW